MKKYLIAGLACLSLAGCGTNHLVKTILITIGGMDAAAIFVYDNKDVVIHEKDVDAPAVVAEGSSAKYGVMPLELPAGNSTPKDQISRSPQYNTDLNIHHLV